MTDHISLISDAAAPRRGASIRGKLLLALTLTTASALIIATVVLAWLDVQLSHEDVRNNLQVQAQVAAQNLGESVVSQDIDTARTTLQALQANSNAEYAGLYLIDGTLLAEYRGSDIGAQSALVPGVIGGYFEVSSPVYSGFKKVGVVKIIGRSARLTERLQDTATSTIGILLLSLGLGLIISLPIQQQLIQPIRDLVRLTVRVREERNYSIRADRGFGTEFDELAAGFNSMLDQIQERDQTMEERVGLQTDAMRNEYLLFSAAIGSVPSGLVLYERYTGEITRSNNALHDMFNFKLRPSNIRELEELLADQELPGSLLTGDSIGPLSLKISMPGKADVHVQLTNILLDNERQCLLVIHNQTELMATAEALHEEKELAHTTLDSIADGVISTTEEGVIKYMNPVARNLLIGDGPSKSDVRIDEIYKPFDLQSAEPSRCPVTECISSHSIIEPENVALFFAHSGAEAIVEHSVTPMFDMDKKLIGTTLVFRDVTQIRKLIHRISYQATHDELTDLVNRREFEFRLKQVIDRAEVDRTQFAILYIDLDRFKVVNDSCGHLVGDKLLKEIAGVMRGCVRKGDALARLGGDEFGLILENCDRSQACIVADKILKSVSSYEFFWEGEKYIVGASIGLVPIMYGGESSNTVLNLADAACYSAKDGGRNQVYVYEAGDPEISERFGQARWVSRIRRAADEDRFFIVRQPIVPIADKPRHGHYEILMRMRDVDGSIVPPTAYLPAAEHFDLMGMIDRWVVKETLNHLANNTDDIAQYSINLSGITFNDSGFAGDVRRWLEEKGVAAERLCFEITETAAVANIAGARKLIETLKKVGCQFSLDDFGTGMSSFAYLRSLPVDFLKIDGLFIKNMKDNLVDYAMVRSIHELGAALNIRTVAEWVEDEETLIMLEKIGVNFAQGWHVGKIEQMDGNPL